MNENNFESLDEQQIAELYGDVLEEPVQVANIFQDADCAVRDFIPGGLDEYNCYRKYADRELCGGVFARGYNRCMRNKGW